MTLIKSCFSILIIGSLLPSKINSQGIPLRGNSLSPEFGATSLASYFSKNGKLCMGILLNSKTFLGSVGHSCAQINVQTSIHLLSKHISKLNSKDSQKIQEISGIGNNFPLLKVFPSPSINSFPLPLPPKVIPPPEDATTECHTFTFNVNKKPSRKWQDFTITRNPSFIVNNDFCTFTGKPGSTLCANVTSDCKNGDFPSFLICRKWWNQQELRARAQEYLELTRQDLPPEDHRDIEFVCLFYPGKPWCNPRDFCGFYPKAERCGNDLEQSEIIISDWYLTGILVDKGMTTCSGGNSASTAYYYAPTLYQSSLEFL